MGAQVRGIVAGLKSYRMNLLVFTILFMIGLWGHHSHWSLHLAEAHAEASPVPLPVASVLQPPAPQAAPPSAAAMTDALAGTQVQEGTVRFNSAQAVERCGIQLGAVTEQPMSQEVVANGVLVYDQTRVAQLSTRASGTVWRVEKKVGEPIRKGDILAIVEAVDVGTAKAEFLQALVQTELKEKIMTRYRTLGNVLSERQIQEAETALREARIHLSNAQQKLINLGLPLRADDFKGLEESELTARIQFLGLPESLRNSLPHDTTTANLIPLFSPLDGIVIGHDITVGEAVHPSAPQFTVADISRMWIYLDVSRVDAMHLSLGQPIEFRCDGFSGTVASTISWISTEVDSKTRTVRVRAEADNPLVEGVATQGFQQRQLRANSFGTGRIRVREKPQVAVVPNESLQWVGDQHVVYVCRGEAEFEGRTVRPGLADQRFTEIIEGLTPGERIVTSGSHVLKSEAMRVRLASGKP